MMAISVAWVSTSSGPSWGLSRSRDGQRISVTEHLRDGWRSADGLDDVVFDELAFLARSEAYAACAAIEIAEGAGVAAWSMSMALDVKSSLLQPTAAKRIRK
jgi:hypothetical protein